MRILLLILFSLCFSSFHGERNAGKKSRFTCTLTSKFQTYKIGQVPDIQVSIVNNSNNDIYLIGALDGSAVKRRMPYCYFTIEKPKPDTISMLRCGVTNPIRIEECRLVKPRGKFNPYQRIDEKGFWTDHTITQKETFRNPGIYKIQFHYSTNSTDIQRFLGSWDKNPDTAQLKKIFDKIPKIDLSSNVLEIMIEE